MSFVLGRGNHRPRSRFRRISGHCRQPEPLLHGVEAGLGEAADARCAGLDTDVSATCHPSSKCRVHWRGGGAGGYF